MIFLVVAVPALLYLLWSRRIPKAAKEFTWTPAPAPSAVTDETIARGSQGSVARTLAWTEARLQLRSAAVLQGAVFCALILVLFYVVFPGDTQLPVWTQLAIFPVMVYPLAGMALVASHRAVLRGRRDHAEELFEATPTGSTTRTIAHSGAAGVPVVIAVLFWVGVLVSSASLTFGRVDGALIVDGVMGWRSCSAVRGSVCCWPGWRRTRSCRLSPL